MAQTLSRRQFVQASAGAGISIPTILPSHVWAGPSPNEQLQFACIGMGGQMRITLSPQTDPASQRHFAGNFVWSNG